MLVLNKTDIQKEVYISIIAEPLNIKGGYEKLSYRKLLTFVSQNDIIGTSFKFWDIPKMREN